jgi:excisionase family DNA binding protein
MVGKDKASWGTSDDHWLSVDEAAAYLNVSPKSVYRRADALGGVKFGSRLLFKVQIIDGRLRNGALDPKRRLPMTARQERTG